jgi:proline iminopeptidase
MAAPLPEGFAMHADNGLYPPIEPFATHRLAVDPPHELYIEECGDPDGVPVLFLHGGPGAGAKPSQRRTFDPARCRAILFDQRGCGRSTPSAELNGNDTASLIADIERVREHLGIDRWLVTGGSWGSFLSLAYAQAHPDRVMGLRLHGVFTGRRDETRFWFHGIGRFFPEAFADFAGHVPEGERDDLLAAYYKRLIDPDPTTHMAAAEALRGFSARTQTLLPSPTHIAALTEPRAALEISRIFCHFCANAFFVPEGALLANMDQIAHLPCEIVQGRYDVVTPPATAFEVAKALPKARFTMVDLANHVATGEAPAMSAALRAATDRLLDAVAEDTPPAIDAYLEQRACHSPAISDDGALLGFISDESGMDALWTLSLVEKDATPAQRLVLDERVGSIAFRPGTRDLMLTTDVDGDERHQLWLLREGAAAPEPLTDDPRFVHAWGAFDKAGARIAFSSNARDARHMDVHVQDVETGARRMLVEATGWRSALSFTPDGAGVLMRDDSRGGYDAGLHLVDIDTGATRTLLENRQNAHVAATRWVDGGAALLLVTDAGRDFHGIVSLDVATGAMTDLARPEGDVELLAVSKDESKIAYAINVEGYSRVVIQPRAGGAAKAVEGIPGGRVTTLLFAEGGAALVLAITSFDRPSVILRVDLESGAVSTLAAGHWSLDAEDVVNPTAAMIPSFDNQRVPAFVFTPKHPREGRPALVIVHGGPESQYAAHWRADVQYLVRRGWTVVAPNVRGSTGYGRTWQAGDDLDLRMDSVRDLKAVRDWVAAQPGIDADKLVVYGQSYGGFMTLAALTEYPEDWRAGAEFYGIADFNTLLATTGPWRRTLRAVEYGNPDTEAGQALLHRISPMRKIDRLTAPLFIAHGFDDPRVVINESEMIFAALRGRGHPVKYVRVPREGHGFKRLHNQRTVFRALVQFLHCAVGA